jgi:aminoglycoside phosphotransferase (APT) family kinase protein
MFSLSKTPISLDTAQAIVRAHFGGSAQIAHFRELTDGYFNAAYRIELSGGDAYVLKVAPPASVRVLRYERDIMRAEVEALRLVRAHTSVPAPSVISYDPSQRILPNDYFLMTCLPGAPLNTLRDKMTPDERDDSQRQAGGFLRQVNSITGVRFGYLAGGGGPPPPPHPLNNHLYRTILSFRLKGGIFWLQLFIRFFFYNI